MLEVEPDFLFKQMENYFNLTKLGANTWEEVGIGLEAGSLKVAEPQCSNLNRRSMPPKLWPLNGSRTLLIYSPLAIEWQLLTSEAHFMFYRILIESHRLAKGQTFNTEMYLHLCRCSSVKGKMMKGWWRE